MSASTRSLMTVAKFGGTSVADYTAMLRCLKIVSSYPATRVVVVSAPQGVTNRLVALSEVSLSSEERATLLAEIKQKVESIVLTFPQSIRQDTAAAIDDLLRAISQSANALATEHQLSKVDALLACGERLSTILLTALFYQEGQACAYVDARTLIKTDDRFNRATVLLPETKLAVSEQLSALKGLIITEGFIGSTLQNETTTLGRGGSDYSAALLAEAIQADVLQIWTDVSGIYTVDPKLAPKARPIDHMSFAEAAELATFGAKVLHPATLWPAIRQSISVFVGSSMQPESSGTWIYAKEEKKPMLRAIALRAHQSLLTITSLDMLQAHGFLANVFRILAAHQLSVDLVTTSEISVAITLNDADLKDESVLVELQQMGNVSLSLEKNLSLIALVGNAIHLTSGVSGELFNEINHFNIRLICHGASTHNLCFLVHEKDAKEIIQLLHAKFFETKFVNDYFDVPSILQQCEQHASSPNQWPLPVTTAVNHHNHLTIGGCDVVALATEFNTPLYIVDERHLKTMCRALKQAAERHPMPVKMLYASKALSTTAIDRLIQAEGFGIDVMSEGELLTALNANFSPDLIYFHGNNKSRAELCLAIKHQCRIVIDNWHELHLLIELANELALANVDVLIRFTPNVNSFTHQHIRTGQIDSKFGFNYDEVHEVIATITAHPVFHLLGLHAHIGSQISDLSAFKEVAIIAAKLMNDIYQQHQFSLTEINLGGGLGVNYTGEQAVIPSVDQWLAALIEPFMQHYDQGNRSLPTLLIEPGRAIIATACVTAYRVGSEKTIKTGKKYVAVDGGMSDNPRPITYGSTHRILLGNRVQSDHRETITVVGKHCESGDVLFKSVTLPTTQSGDILIALGTGAYNYSQSSNYNRIPKPAMVLVNEGQARLIVARETSSSLLMNDVDVVSVL